MKNIFFRTAFFVAAFAGLFFSACQKERIEASENLETAQIAFDPGEIYNLSQTAQVDDRVCTTGDVAGAFNGVIAYKNCPIGSTNTYGNNYVSGVYVGKKWQCVEYVQRYYMIVYGMEIKPAFGDANTFYTNNNHADVGLQKFANGTTAPQVGDILVSTSYGVGHVAIVSGVTSTTVDIIDQNFSSNSTRTLTRSGNTVGVFSANYSVAGLVRKIQVAPASTPTLLTPSQNATNVLSPVNCTWSCPNGTEYRIQIIKASNFQSFSTATGFSGTMAYNNNIGNIQSFSWTQSEKGVKYYWTVRANNSGGTSQFAAYRTFTTKP